jgi:hypothetical protein
VILEIKITADVFDHATTYIAEIYDIPLELFLPLLHQKVTLLDKSTHNIVG